jgi:peptidoglycan/xylan/chitin deacetylase (PgdA/CDA1 family)
MRRRLGFLIWLIALGGCRLPDTVELVAERDPRILYSVEARDPVVALTLDDGPDEIVTPRILAVLEAHHARATFFLISDRIAGREEAVAAIVDAGHEIGNHLTRDEPSVDLSPEEFEAELLRSDAALRDFASPRWFRPGSGWYDDWMFPILERNGYRMALGTAYPLDATIPWVWFTSRVTLSQVDPGDVIILHDVGDRGDRTVATLERVLPELRRRGLRVVTLSELVAASQIAER